MSSPFSFFLLSNQIISCFFQQPVFHRGSGSPKACLAPPWCWVFVFCYVFFLLFSLPIYNVFLFFFVLCISHLLSFVRIQWPFSTTFSYATWCPCFFLPIRVSLKNSCNPTSVPLQIFNYSRKSLDSSESFAAEQDAPLGAVVPSPHHLGVQFIAPSLCGAEPLSSMLYF